jgi:hypothetical protein
MQMICHVFQTFKIVSKHFSVRVQLEHSIILLRQYFIEKITHRVESNKAIR